MVAIPHVDKAMARGMEMNDESERDDIRCEAVVLVGLQGSGKSTFCTSTYLNTHLRISHDLLRTKNRERLLLGFCAETRMPFVVDNTNLTAEGRRRFVRFAAENGFRTTCVFFKPDVERSLAWNAKREGKARIPDCAIRSAMRKLEEPTFDEGFDRIVDVVPECGDFRISERKRK